MPVAGERIAERYRLKSRIAVGGMGEVWLGRDELLRRPVAIKTLHLQPGLAPADRDLVVQRAMREARITARLHHPHAVQVFDVLDQPDGPCLIMEYVPSRSLQDLVRGDGPRAVDDVARTGTQIAAALAAAHRAGIVHRDVKPGNVLIADDGTAKLTDFGISHAFDDVSLTSTGMVTGTPAFLAPEVARGAPSSFASDVYSLGVTLYFAVDGESPFGNDTNPMAILHRVASEPPRPPRGAGPLAPLLGEMMAAQPEDRPRMVDIPLRLTGLHLVPADVAEHTTTPLRTRPTTPSPTREFAATPPPRRTAPPAPPTPPVRTAPPARTPPAQTAPPAQPPPSAPTARPAQSPPTGPDHRRRRPFVIAAVAALAAVAVVVGILVSQSDGSGDHSAAGTASAGSSAPPRTSASPTTAQTPSQASTSPPATTSSASSQAPTSTSTSTTPSTGPVTAAELTSAMTQYYQLVPGDLDAGWARLTTRFQKGRAGGRQAYDKYWNSISRVDVADVRADAPRTATARLTYHYTSGRTVTQTTTFTFVRQGGVLKIDAES